MLRDFCLLQTVQRSQKLKTDATLYAQDSTQLCNTDDKLKRWQEHFAQVSNISAQLTPSVVDAVLETIPESSDECDDSLTCVPTEDEVSDAVQCLKNRRAPGGDGITAELLKLGGEDLAS